MNTTKKLEDTQLAIHNAFQLRFPFFNPHFLIIGAKESANRVSAKFALAIKPYMVTDEYGAHYRHGAKWILHVPHIASWSLASREILINTVLDEVEEYLSKGYILRDEETYVPVGDDERYRLQRTGNRAVN